MAADFARYLAAKKSVDDRALNAGVWQALLRHFPGGTPARPVQILELGGGIGTMVERLDDQGLLQTAEYTLVDTQPFLLERARQRLAGREVWSRLNLVPDDCFAFLDRAPEGKTWDLVMAHAFLDLVDVPAALGRMVRVLPPGGLLYCTLNFDGVTILEPVVDPEFDRQVMAIYHQTMDERLVGGRRAGDSRTGRHLPRHLRDAGLVVMAAGSSDWVVLAGPAGYPADEAFFLEFILETIARALERHPELPPRRFASWHARRRRQLDRGELVYIAHQLDYLAHKPID